MDPNSGKVYTDAEVAKMTAERRAELVEMRGSEEHIRRISEAVQAMNRAERRAAARSDRKRGR